MNTILRLNTTVILSRAITCSVIVVLMLHPFRVLAQQNPDLSVFRSVVRIKVSGESENLGSIIQTGSGFYLGKDGLILTAFHVVGRDSKSNNEIQWKALSDNRPNPIISIEMVDVHNVLGAPLNVLANVRRQDSSLDIAVLELPGTNYPGVKCSTTTPVKEGTQLRGQGWQTGRATYDPLGEGHVGPRDPADGIRLRLIGMTAFKGNSGGPVYDRAGVVVGVITSGRDQRLIAGAPETFATPLLEVKALLPSLSWSLTCDEGQNPPSETTQFMVQLASYRAENCETARSEADSYRGRFAVDPKLYFSPGKKNVLVAIPADSKIQADQLAANAKALATEPRYSNEDLGNAFVLVKPLWTPASCSSS
jgi:Trypsin-like peptidase domain